MGNGTSKEEQLYQAVQNSNYNAVKALRRDGASLEFLDKEGRTPLILACTRGDLFEMVLTLLNLGANINAYRPGTFGGYPLHHAAKRGLDKTVLLLLSRGADPLAVNDDSLTPLDMARSRGHVAVVRMIEDRLCVFSGMLRELSGPGFLEAIAPQWLTKKIWVVVLPTESDPRRTPKFDLVIYQSPKVPVPRSLISLSKAEVEEPNLSSPDPVVIILDRNSKTKYKFLAEVAGDKVQIERFYKACKGTPMVGPASSGTPQAVSQGLSALTRPPSHPHTQSEPQSKISEEAALKMAIDASLRTASAEGVLRVPYSDQAGPSSRASTAEEEPPSAPPLPIHYPAIDTSIDAPVEEESGGEKEKGGQCVVCWDAPAEGVCIPCGHLAGCMECLSQIMSKHWGCPVCRASIDQVIKVYSV
jgi:protein neuralized